MTHNYVGEHGSCINNCPHTVFYVNIPQNEGRVETNSHLLSHLSCITTIPQ